MRSFWSDPYLWIHLAGVATVPLWLELCWLGLAVGDPVLPYWLELLAVGAFGIVPIVWMQWQRPFDIYSLLLLAVRLEHLTPQQRQVLTRFTVPRNRVLAIATAALLATALYQIYVFAPIAAAITPFADQSRWVGLLIAAIAFLAANLFTQVPVAVASVLLTGETAFATTIPLSFEEIQQRFTVFGFPVQKILPVLIVPERKVAIAAPVPPTKPDVTPVQDESSGADEIWTDEVDATSDGASLTEPSAIASDVEVGSDTNPAVDAMTPDGVETSESIEIASIESVVIEVAEVTSAETGSAELEAAVSVAIEITESVEFLEVPASDETESPDAPASVVSASAGDNEGDDAEIPASDPESALDRERAPDSQLDSADATIPTETITTEENSSDDAAPNDL